MSTTRRTLLASLTSVLGAASGQTTIGFKADTMPERSECGIGALMPWADALWAVTYNNEGHRLRSGPVSNR